MSLLLPILLIVAAAFAALFLMRVGGAHRRSATRHAPSIILAAAAILFVARGNISMAALFGIAAMAIYFWPSRPAPRVQTAPPPPRRGSAMSETQARAILGVSPSATEADIRTAFRRKMASAHPDHGGSNEEAARINAARDALLRR